MLVLNPSTRRLGVRLYGSVLFYGPRLLIPAASLLAALFGATGCVSAVRYEEARSAAEVEAEAHRRANTALQQARAEAAELRAELREKEQRLAAEQSSLEATKFEQNTSEKERDESRTLVEQLRAELRRTGKHLEAYSEEKARLERELLLAKQAVPSQPNEHVLVRDLGVAIAAMNLQQDVSVAAQGDGVVLRIAADALFEPGSPLLRPRFSGLLAASALLPASAQGLSGTLREVSMDPSQPANLGADRRARLMRALLENGVESRVTLEPGEGVPQFYELELRGVAAPVTPAE